MFIVSGTPTITARCTTPDGTTREANTTLEIVISQPVQAVQTMSDETLGQLCYGATSDAFIIYENTMDVEMGTINRCKDVNGITVSYKVNKRKFFYDNSIIKDPICLVPSPMYLFVRND